MPTIMRINRFRLFFFSDEGKEPLHVHVESGDAYAKFWLDPVQLSKSSGYSAREINVIRRHIFEHRIFLKEKWHEYFGVQE